MSGRGGAWSPWLRGGGVVVGIALLAAAVLTVARRHEAIGEALGAMRHPAPGYLAIIVLGVWANVALAALTFSVLISRYGRVGVGEMQALVAASGLLNFLPFRPGLFGRIAYHRAYNAIPAVATVKTLVHAIALSLAAGGYLAAGLFVSSRGWTPLWVVVALPFPLLGAGFAVGGLRVWAAAAAIRLVEMLVWSARYYAAFALVGAEIEPAGAIAFACIGMVAMLVPFVGNGLGVREWAVGLAAPLLTPYVLQVGLTAELLNRAAELVVVTAIGLAGIAWLVRRRSVTPSLPRPDPRP